jgi:hypothetical protein
MADIDGGHAMAGAELAHGLQHMGLGGDAEPVVGSSMTMSRGRLAKAMAMATRRCWPPES